MPFAIFDDDFDDNVRALRADLMHEGVKPQSTLRKSSSSPAKPIAGVWAEQQDHHEVLPGGGNGYIKSKPATSAPHLQHLQKEVEPGIMYLYFYLI